MDKRITVENDRRNHVGGLRDAGRYPPFPASIFEVAAFRRVAFRIASWLCACRYSRSFNYALSRWWERRVRSRPVSDDAESLEICIDTVANQGPLINDPLAKGRLRRSMIIIASRDRADREIVRS